DAVVKVLQSNQVNYWTGQVCREFEKEFAHYTQNKTCHCVDGMVQLHWILP
ncbi:hypothetical protein GEW_06307, partial [Pasteurella multocida subsp. gallicida str. Anand1_poultry]